MYNNLINYENKWIFYRKIWRIIVKPIVISSDILPVLEGCNFCMANESFFHADRTLDFHVLLYVVSGCIYVTEGEIDYEVHAGELLFLRSGVRHYGKKASPKGTSWYFAHFYLEEPTKKGYCIHGDPMPSSVDSFRIRMELPKYIKGFDQSRAAEMLAGLTDSIHTGNVVVKQEECDSSCYAGHQSIVSCPDSQAAYPAAIWYANARLFEILTEIAVGSLPPAPKHSLADQIAEYLSEHAAENFSAAALEKYFFLSYKHMSAVFKKEKHMTLHQYHTHARMGNACQMLCTTMKSIGEISEELGYRDMLYFSRCFHQTMGMSPTEYRRQMLNY